MAIAGAIHSFSSPETLTAANLNDNFTHIHNALRGGTHTLITNPDVAANAAIAHSKLATPALVPKAFAGISADCTSNPCNMYVNQGMTTAIRGSGGSYTVSFSARTDDSYAAYITARSSVAAYCRNNGQTSSTVKVGCYDATGNVTDSGFQILLMDNDN